LLDTGCDRSICPRCLCRNAKLVPVTTELYLANGARLEIFGATRLHFEINGRKMFADVLVSDGVDELFLGYDCLVRIGRHFEVRVDNMALTYYQKMKDPTGQAARYLDFVSNFSFDIKHSDGSRHINADSLSRLRPCEFDGGKPCSQCNKRVIGKHTLKAVQTRAKAARSGADTANDGLIDAADVQSPGGPHQTSGDRLTSDSSYRSRKRRRRSRAAAALDNTAP